MIKGRNLMVGIKEQDGMHTIAMATSCTLEMSTELSDATTKDDNDNGVNQEVTSKAWNMKTENMIPVDENNTYSRKELLKRLKAGTEVYVNFSIYNATGKETGDGHDWGKVSGVTSDTIFRGWSLIESVDINASNKEKATLSASFKGNARPEIVAQPANAASEE